MRNALARLTPLALLSLCALPNTVAAQRVQYRLTDRPPGTWRVGGAPLLEIGGAEGGGPTEFTHIVGVTRLSNGSVVVADALSRELRHFSADGEFLGLIARQGNGPGELSELDHLTSVRDTLVVFEGREAVQLFTASGWVRRSRRASLAGHIVQVPQAVLRPSEVLWWVRQGSERPLSARGDSLFAGLSSAADSAIRLLAALPLSPTYSVPGGRAIYPLGFAPEPLIAAYDDRWCVGYPAVYSIRCFDRAGRVVLELMREVSAHSVTSAARDAYRAAASGRRADGTSRYEGSLRAHRERVAQAARFAASFPAYSQLLISVGGELWVRRYEMEDGLSASRWRSNPRPSRWSVYDRSGRWVADATLPPRFAPSEIGTDYVVGVTSDADDVERVTMWRLTRR